MRSLGHSKTRIANKTIWALEDSIGHCLDARRAWRQAMDRAERQIDPVMVVALARLSDSLWSIETLLRDARDGNYNGPKTDGS